MLRLPFEMVTQQLPINSLTHFIQNYQKDFKRSVMCILASYHIYLLYLG